MKIRLIILWSLLGGPSVAQEFSVNDYEVLFHDHADIVRRIDQGEGQGFDMLQLPGGVQIRRYATETGRTRYTTHDFSGHEAMCEMATVAYALRNIPECFGELEPQSSRILDHALKLMIAFIAENAYPPWTETRPANIEAALTEIFDDELIGYASLQSPVCENTYFEWFAEERAEFINLLESRAFDENLAAQRLPVGGVCDPR